MPAATWSAVNNGVSGKKSSIGVVDRPRLFADLPCMAWLANGGVIKSVNGGD